MTSDHASARGDDDEEGVGDDVSGTARSLGADAGGDAEDSGGLRLRQRADRARAAASLEEFRREIGTVAASSKTSGLNSLVDGITPLASQFDFGFKHFLSTAASKSVVSANATRGLAGSIAGMHNFSTGFATKSRLNVGKVTTPYGGWQRSIASSITTMLNPSETALKAIKTASLPALGNLPMSRSLVETLPKMESPTQSALRALSAASRSLVTTIPTPQISGILEAIASLNQALDASACLPSAALVGSLAGLTHRLNVLDGLPGPQALLSVSAATDTARTALAGLAPLPSYDWAAFSSSLDSEARASIYNAARASVAGITTDLVDEQVDAFLEQDELLTRFEREQGFKEAEDSASEVVHLRARLVRFARRIAHNRPAQIALIAALTWAHYNMPEFYDWVDGEVGFWSFMLPIALTGSKKS